mmetsp:Transcript_25332/g.81697  ORF Transcript_25332/g.81697 Transcript_25332/m.81697 type:complete len:233 (-) Transcript_25332:352-1050(-)
MSASPSSHAPCSTARDCSRNKGWREHAPSLGSPPKNRTSLQEGGRVRAAPHVPRRQRSVGRKRRHRRLELLLVALLVERAILARTAQPKCLLDAVPHAQVARGEDVGLQQSEHLIHVRGPRSDALDCCQLGVQLGRAETRVEEHRVREVAALVVSSQVEDGARLGVREARARAQGLHVRREHRLRRDEARVAAEARDEPRPDGFGGSAGELLPDDDPAQRAERVDVLRVLDV